MAGAAKPIVLTQSPEGLEKAVLRNADGTTAEVHLHGGHVTSWVSGPKKEELLFVSEKAVFKPPKAIRGGIPVCFPQFSDFGPLGQHGFARNQQWSVDTLEENLDGATVTLLLRSGQEELQKWPHKFELRMRVQITTNGNLLLRPSVKNIGIEDFTFTFALHTYFAVSDISNVEITGVQGLEYLESLVTPRKQEREERNAVDFKGEVDRIYLNTPNELQIVDRGNRTLTIKKTGLPDAIVWNPWIEKAKATADLGDEEYHKFVCVEAAAVSNPITLQPGQVWTAEQELSAS
jgi:glucose-6-phosphate 1-epimerase